MIKFIVLLVLSFISFSASSEDLYRFSSWPSYGKNAGIYYAKNNGLFEKYGLDVKIINSFQSPLPLLEAGKADIIQILASSAISAINKGGDFLIVGIRDEHFPVGTVVLNRSSIRQPKDFSGKSWGHSAGFSPERYVLAELASKNEFSAESVKLVHIDFPARLPALLSNKIDMISGWYGSGYPRQANAALEKGEKLRLILWRDYGIDIYGEVLLVRGESVRTDASRVKSFLKGLRDGMLLAKENPKAAISSVLKDVPQLKGKEVTLMEELNQSLEIAALESGSEFFISKEKLQATAEASGVKSKNISNTYVWMLE